MAARLPRSDTLTRTQQVARTPLQINGPLSELVGVEVWVKREDLQDNVGSGVKRRAVAAILDEQAASGRSPIVIDGVPQSNCLMAMAHYCQLSGTPLYVILRGRGPSHASGNYQRVVSSGAQIIELSDPRHFPSVRDAVVSDLRAMGNQPLVVPAGAASPTALAGLIGLGLEIAEQEAAIGTRLDVVVLPVGTGGTITGLALSRNFHCSHWRLVGVRIDEYPAETYLEKFTAAAASLDLISPQQIATLDCAFSLYDGALGGGYGKFTDADIHDSERLLEQTGLYFGPTYMLKAIRGLIQMVAKRQIPRSSRVLLLHTGGVNERSNCQKRLGMSCSTVRI